MKPALTVFFSRTGHTASVAEAICDGMTTDKQLQERRTSTYMSAGLGALVGRASDLEETVTSPVDYELVILGTPVWSVNLSCPMRAYITAHASEFRDVAFFCTEGGIGGQRVFGQMKRLCGRSPLATLEISRAELNSGASERKNGGVFVRGGVRHFRDENTKFELSLMGHTGGGFDDDGSERAHWLQIASEVRHRYDGTPFSAFLGYQGDFAYSERLPDDCCDEQVWVHSLWVGLQLSFGFDTLFAEDRYGVGTSGLPNFRAPISYADELD